MKAKFLSLLLFACGVWLFPLAAHADSADSVLNYQGRVSVGDVVFEGNGQFKFALVNDSGEETFWSNDGTSTNGSQPGTAIELPVVRGLYSIYLGDSSISGMEPISPEVFENPDLRLRVWFSDGTHGFQQLTPDQRFTAAPQALHAATADTAKTALSAETVAAGSIGAEQLDPALEADLARLSGDANFTGKVTAESFVGDGSGLSDLPLVTSQTISDTLHTALSNHSYLLTSNAKPKLRLPSEASEGDIIHVAGTGENGWTVQISDQGQPWQGVSGLPTARWESVTLSADGRTVVAAGQNTHIYVSRDGGRTWKPRENLRRWTSVASSADGTRLVATATNIDHIYTSDDAGINWTARGTANNWSSVASSADGRKLVAASSGGGYLYTSTDYGETWTQRESWRSWSGVASSFNGEKLVAVARGAQIYTSDDSGLTWIPREKNRTWYSVASSADGVKLIAADYNGYLYVSDDSGATWIAQGGVGKWRDVASSADGNVLLAIDSESDRLYRSIDSGATWDPTGPTAFWLTVASSTEGDFLLAGQNSGRVFTYREPLIYGEPGAAIQFHYTAGKGWQPLGQSAGRIVGTIDDTNLSGNVATLDGVNVFTNPDNFFTGDGSGLTDVPLSRRHAMPGSLVTAIPNRSYILSNEEPSTLVLPSGAKIGDSVNVSGTGGNGWRVQLSDQAQPWRSISNGVQPSALWHATAFSADGTTLVAAGQDTFLYISRDGGVTWNPRESERRWRSVASSADGTKLVAVATNIERIYTSNDSGETWTPRAHANNWASVASSADGKQLVAVTQDRLYISRDSGETWKEPADLRLGSTASWRSVASSADGMRLVGASNGGYLYTSADAGVTWTRGNLFGGWVSVASSDDGRKLIAANYNNGLYTSKDYGATWTRGGPVLSWEAVASSADGTWLAAVALSQEPIYLSRDSGATWKAAATSPDASWRTIASSADGSQLLAGRWSGALHLYHEPMAQGQPGTSGEFFYGENGWQQLKQSADQLVGMIDDDRLSQNVARLAGDAAFEGTVSAGAFSGDGRELLNLDAEALTGIVPDLNLSENIARLDADQTFLGINDFINPENAFTGTFTGDGSGLTGLNATNLTGTISDSNLSGNVARLDADQIFTGSVTAESFSGSFLGDGSNLTDLPIESLVRNLDPVVAWGANMGSQ